MSTLSSRLAAPVQIAYAVDDIHEAARTWGDRGVGPFFVREHIELAAVRVDGAPGTFDHSAAYGQWGDVMLELIAVHEPVDTPTGLHHLAFFVDDLADARRASSARGWSEVLFAETPGGTPFAHVDARDELGHLVEFYEPTDRIRRLYALVADAADGWAGVDPVRAL